jgi:hypothetical protein
MNHGFFNFPEADNWLDMKGNLRDAAGCYEFGKTK